MIELMTTGEGVLKIGRDPLRLALHSIVQPTAHSCFHHSVLLTRVILCSFLLPSSLQPSPSCM